MRKLELAAKFFASKISTIGDEQVNAKLCGTIAEYCLKIANAAIDSFK